jgi:hypothetical protein
MIGRIAAAFMALATPSYLMAQETTSYTYDALGRLTKSARTGGPANNVTTEYSHDAADNRTKVVVQGAPVKVVVVPLNGFTVIPIPTN